MDDWDLVVYTDMGSGLGLFTDVMPWNKRSLYYSDLCMDRPDYDVDIAMKLKKMSCGVTPLAHYIDVIHHETTLHEPPQFPSRQQVIFGVLY